MPLGEAAESYLLRLSTGGTLRREMVLSAPAWTWSAALQAADGMAGPRRIEVAQISDSYGPGPFARLELP